MKKKSKSASSELAAQSNKPVPPILFGAAPGIEFSCGDISCLLNSQFNIVLYSEHTALKSGSLYPVGFIIPTDYHSFIKARNKNFDCSTDVASIFQFSHPHHAKELAKYVAGIPDKKRFVRIPELAPVRESGSKTKK